MIRGVIFDADGVIFDSMPFWENIGKIYLNTKGVKAKADLNQKLEKLSMEEGARYLSEKYNINQSPEEVGKEIKEILKMYYCNQVSMKKGIDVYLEQFYKRKIPMIIATSGDYELTEKALQKLNIHHFFKEIITCTKAGKSKSFPDIYDMAAVEIGENILYKEIVVFEDAYHAICTAKKSGFKVVGVYDRSNKSYFNKIGEISDYVIMEYGDFDKMWKTINEL